MKKYSLVFFLILSFLPTKAQDYTIKDKTKYYVSDIENFNNYSSNGWSILDESQLKTIAKALNISKAEAAQVIENTHSTNHPVSKRDYDVGYVMYKVCELQGYRNGNFTYTNAHNVLYLMYIPNELNDHIPPDKLDPDGKGFFQITLKGFVSTSPLSADYYKPVASLANDNYSFGFRFVSTKMDSVVVYQVIKTGPADLAGLKEGDVIVAVNETNVRYKSFKDIGQFFKECPFTNNTFKVLRNNAEISLKINKVNAKSLEMVCLTGDCENGESEFEHIKGYRVKATMKNGKVVGKATFNTHEGTVFYEGEAENLRLSNQKYNIKYAGFGVEQYTNGDRYEGEFGGGEKSGSGTYYFADGTSKTGIWKANVYYDDISIGFAYDRFDAFKSKVHLFGQKNDFLQNADQLSFKAGELDKLKSTYKLSDTEVAKLLKLCDFKYKPQSMNTPAKFRKLINDNQEKYDYEVFLLENLKATDEKYYSVLRMPEELNRHLPDAMKITNGNALYFMAPYSEVSYISYLDYKMYKEQEEAKKQWEITKAQNEAANNRAMEWRAKNEFKGVMIYQFEEWDEFAKRIDYTYKVVSIFGPKNQELLEDDRPDIDLIVGVKTLKKVHSNFHEGMDEVQAENYITGATGSHRFSINNNYSYTIPERSSYDASSEARQKELDEIDARIAANQKEIDILKRDFDQEKLLEKVELRKKAMNDVLMSDKKAYNNPTRVEVVEVLTSDKYYQETKKFVGKTGTIEGSLTENGDGTYYGTILFPDEKYSIIFYSVKVKVLSSF